VGYIIEEINFVSIAIDCFLERVIEGVEESLDVEAVHFTCL